MSKGKPKSINLICDRKNAKPPQVVMWTGGHRHTSGEKKATRTQKRKECGKRFNVWTIHTADITEFTDHPAQFPEALARDHILSWSNPGDLVLDPMMGSGTTGKMAVKYQRDFIGIDISTEYVKIAQRRIDPIRRQAVLPLFGGDGRSHE